MVALFAGGGEDEVGVFGVVGFELAGAVCGEFDAEFGAEGEYCGVDGGADDGAEPAAADA